MIKRNENEYFLFYQLVSGINRNSQEAHFSAMHGILKFPFKVKIWIFYVLFYADILIPNPRFTGIMKTILTFVSIQNLA